MALCLNVSPGSLFSGDTTTTVRVGALVNSTTGSTTLVSKVPYTVSDAVYTNGAFSCTTGAYLLLTTSEVNGLKAQPFAATSEHYAAVTAIFGAALTALCIVWGVKKVLSLINQHTDS